MKTFTAEKVFALGYRAADALTAALERGFDPASDPERTFTPVDAGEFLTMPSSVGKDAGIKILTLAPHNPEKGRPFIQGTYLLCDAETLTPHSLVEGIALTALRTPAVAIAGARPALSAIAAHVTRRPNIVAFGAGVQGEGFRGARRGHLRSAQSGSRERECARGRQGGVCERGRSGACRVRRLPRRC